MLGTEIRTAQARSLRSPWTRRAAPVGNSRGGLALALLLLGGVTGFGQDTISLTVVDSDGQQIPTGFRWLLQKDENYNVVPGLDDPDTLSLSFHTSHAPVIASGASGTATTVIPIPVRGGVPDVDRRYFVSVLPDSCYSMSGAQAIFGATGTDIPVTVTVHEQPIPTAQISVLVFHDNGPINGAPDAGEGGLAGFKIVLEDAGGRYGISAGQQMMDAFGNMLGTVYDADGNIVKMGDGTIATDANGEALIPNLAPGKYGVTVVPPLGEDWHQTSTIEGKKTIDAWVKANEPSFFVEFGPPGVHVFIGFVKTVREADSPTFFTGTGTVSGQIVNLHNSRPPDFTFYPGQPFPGAWVGLNSGPAGTGQGVYSAPCDDESRFSIGSVPAGTYTLAIWDENLDIIIAQKGFTIAAGEIKDLGPIAVFAWFARLENTVFLDINENGFRDKWLDLNKDGVFDEGFEPMIEEPGIPEQAVNIRWRDGTVYQSMPTDTEGFVPFDEVFPFFNWLVAEVDFARYKATGATIVVDNGGPVLPDAGWDYPSRGLLTPQPQFEVDADGNFVLDGGGNPVPLLNPNTDSPDPTMPTPNATTPNNLSRTETGPVLTQAFQAFLGQTNVIEWGKAPYGSGENGGISGIVYYATTRAEDDPALAAAEVWEPGIPRVQVNLYRDSERDGIVDDVSGDGIVTLADVDNWPFGWRDGGTKGDEDVDRGGGPGFDLNDALDSVVTDSWDDAVPTGTQGPNDRFTAFPGTPLEKKTDGFDGLRNFNQVRPGVFDGGYAFADIPPGDYIVEAVAPPGYEHQKEEDKNVDFGDQFIQASRWTPGMGCTPPDPGVVFPPSPCTGTVIVPPQGPGEFRPPVIVGDLHFVPAELKLFPGVPTSAPGECRPLPDRKLVKLTDGENTACDFFMHTEVPIAGHIVGIILDDTANEFDPTSPAFGEKYSPPFLPISVRDWTGTVIGRSYSDRYGAYNILVPSTYSANLPQPSGMSPNMLTVVLNDPGPILDQRPGSPTFAQMIEDPYFNRKYSQFSYTFQYMPGTTTYLDTPVLPIAAFAGADQFPVDIEFPTGTPVIFSVTSNAPGGGPYVTGTTRTLTITSAGTVQVANPNYGLPGEPATIPRDYGFGTTPGIVSVAGIRIPAGNVTWSAGTISAILPGSARTGELVVIRGDNNVASVLGITVTNNPAGTVRHVNKSVPGAYATIQAAVDAANPGDLILVAPGRYDELVILTEPVQLQGWGAYSTTINAVQSPAEKILNWRKKIEALWYGGAFDLLPGQEIAFVGIEPALASVEGAGVSVYARNTTPANGGFGSPLSSRVDGFTVAGASTGGGVFLNGYVRSLEISNNRITGNNTFAGGGITSGHPALTVQTAAGLEYDDCQNDYLRIHNNQITGNGGMGFAGGGLALFSGTESYEVTDNFICGNFSQGGGGGIGHLGLSDNGTIARNTIAFNQSFNQGLTVSGGGILISGEAPLAINGVTPGSGSVKVFANRIQGNLAGAGDGGGIRAELVNGADVAGGPLVPRWALNIFDNLIVDNVAALAGGGISLQDAVNVRIINNTVARNDSTATAGEAFDTLANESSPQPAGIVSRAHTLNFSLVAPAPAYSDPVLANNIIRQNRSFYFSVIPPVNPGDPPTYRLLPSPTTPDFRDVAVLGTAVPAQLNPQYCVLTSLTGWDGSDYANGTNSAADPLFVTPYYNGPRDPTVIIPEVTTIQVQPAFDEGGNFIDVRFGPLTLTGDYHLGSGSSALVAGSVAQASAIPALATDLEGDVIVANAQGRIQAGAYDGVQRTNKAPIAVNDTYRFDVPLRLVPPTSYLVNVQAGVLSNDYDPDRQPNNNLTATALTSVTPGGTLTFAGAGNGSFTFVPATLAEGVFTYLYRASDGQRASVATITIVLVNPRIPNRPPVPTAAAIATTVGTPGTTRVLPNDPDFGDTHTYTVSVPPTNGVVLPDDATRLLTSGTLVYTPNPGFIGADSLTVLVTDQSGLSGSVAVAVSVTAAYIPPSPDLALQLPPDTDGIDTDGNGNPADDNAYLLLGAGDGFSRMADGRFQYMFGFHDLSFLLPAPAPGVQKIPLSEAMMHGALAGEWPAPTIKVRQGQKLYLNLTNVGMVVRPDLFDPHSIHWHGFPQAAPIFDGVPDSSVVIKMGSNIAYYYNVVEEGTYLYHCHVEATEHMQMGMLGNLYVTPKQDFGPPIEYPVGSGKFYSKFAYNDGDGSTGYDVDFPVQIGSFDPNFHDASFGVQALPFALMKDKYGMLNGRGYPDTVKATPVLPADENTAAVSSVAMLPADPTEVTTAVHGTMDLSAIEDAYMGLDLLFTSGANEGVYRRISMYMGGMRMFHLAEALPQAPAVGDTFVVSRVSQRLNTRLSAVQGQRILLRISNVSVTRLFTLASTVPMTIVGIDAKLLRSATGENQPYTTNSVTLGGGQSLDAIIDTAPVSPGTYLLYTTNFQFLTNNLEDFGGMMTEIEIAAP